MAKLRKLHTGENPAAWSGNLAPILSAKGKAPKRHQPAMPYSALPTFMAKLRERPEAAARALELTILTAARTTVVREATWGEFDLDAAVWTVSSHRMKAGKEHRVALSSQAVALLRALPRAGDLVFPGLRSKPIS